MDEYLSSAQRLGGSYYRCFKDKKGKRLAPLVGYAERDTRGRQLVGENYVNPAQITRIEERPETLAHLAHCLLEKLPNADDQPPVTGFCGVPEGGRALALMLAHLSRGDNPKRYIYPEKAGSGLVFARHSPTPDSRWWLVQDVCGNFSSTVQLFDLLKLFGLLKNYGAKAQGILCFFSPLPLVGDTSPWFGHNLPIIALVRQPLIQYRQDAPAVAADVAAGNVVWDPEHEWPRLLQALDQQDLLLAS